MTGHMLLDMLKSMSLGIAEMQIQFATGHVAPLLTVLACQGNNHVFNKAYRSE
jgi:hypothetical protein